MKKLIKIDLSILDAPKTPVITGNSVSEIEANKNKVLASMEDNHKAKMDFIKEVHEQNMTTIDEYHKAMDAAMARKDIQKVLELMKEINQLMSNGIII